MVDQIKKIAVQYLTEKEVSLMTGRGLSTLRNDRSLGRGLPWVKLMRSVRYELSDVVAYMAERKIYTSDFPGPETSNKQR